MRRMGFNYRWAFLAALVCAGGCATVGQDFNASKVGGLQLGSTTETQARVDFGDPPNVSTENGDQGSFVILIYSYAHADLSNAQVRSLALEFHNGTLNGYAYVSSFDEDKTSADAPKAATIQCGSTNQADVLQILGQPSCKARVPTRMEGVEKAARPGVIEVWGWGGVNAISTLGDHNFDAQMIMIGFNSQGIVTSLLTREVKTPSTQPSTTQPSQVGT